MDRSLVKEVNEAVSDETTSSPVTSLRFSRTRKVTARRNFMPGNTSSSSSNELGARSTGGGLNIPNDGHSDFQNPDVNDTFSTIPSSSVPAFSVNQSLNEWSDCTVNGYDQHTLDVSVVTNASAEQLNPPTQCDAIQKRYYSTSLFLYGPPPELVPIQKKAPNLDTTELIVKLPENHTEETATSTKVEAPVGDTGETIFDNEAVELPSMHTDKTSPISHFFSPPCKSTESFADLTLTPSSDSEVQTVFPVCESGSKCSINSTGVMVSGELAGESKSAVVQTSNATVRAKERICKLKKKNVNRKYRCKVCQIKFPDLKQFRQHANRKPIFVCSTCGKRFSYFCRITTHMRKHKPTTRILRTSKVKLPRRLRVKRKPVEVPAHDVTSARKCVRTIIASGMNKSLENCVLCGKRLLNATRVKMHLLRKHHLNVFGSSLHFSFQVAIARSKLRAIIWKKNTHIGVPIANWKKRLHDCKSQWTEVKSYKELKTKLRYLRNLEIENLRHQRIQFQKNSSSQTSKKNTLKTLGLPLKKNVIETLDLELRKMVDETRHLALKTKIAENQREISSTEQHQPDNKSDGKVTTMSLGDLLKRKKPSSQSLYINGNIETGSDVSTASCQLEERFDCGKPTELKGRRGKPKKQSGGCVSKLTSREESKENKNDLFDPIAGPSNLNTKKSTGSKVKTSKKKARLPSRSKDKIIKTDCDPCVTEALQVKQISVEDLADNVTKNTGKNKIRADSYASSLSFPSGIETEETGYLEQDVHSTGINKNRGSKKKVLMKNATTANPKTSSQAPQSSSQKGQTSAVTNTKSKKVGPRVYDTISMNLKRLFTDADLIEEKQETEKLAYALYCRTEEEAEESQKHFVTSPITDLACVTRLELPAENLVRQPPSAKELDAWYYKLRELSCAESYTGDLECLMCYEIFETVNTLCAHVLNLHHVKGILVPEKCYRRAAPPKKRVTKNAQKAKEDTVFKVPARPGSKIENTYLDLRREVKTLFMNMHTSATLSHYGFPETSVDDVLARMLLDLGLSYCNFENLSPENKLNALGRNIRTYLCVNLPMHVQEELQFRTKSILDVVQDVVKYCSGLPKVD